MKAISLYFLGAIIMFVAFLPLELYAHESPEKREVIVQLSKDEVSILVDYEMPAGEEVERLMVRYDLDHDGIISETEAPRMATRLIPSAFKGLNFEVVNERPGAQEPKVKIRRTKEGQLAMVVLLTYTLPELTEARTLRITLAKDDHAIETPIILQTTNDIMIKAINTKELNVIMDKILRTLTQDSSLEITISTKTP